MDVKKVWDAIKGLFAGKLHVSVPVNNIKNSTINVSNGNFIQGNATFNFENKESVESFAHQLIEGFKDYSLVDVRNDKFKFYVDEAILILKLNDSVSKRFVLKELLLKKFGGEESLVDDADAPTTIALEAMKSLTDSMLRHICAYRVVVNVIPSLIKEGKSEILYQFKDFVNLYGLPDSTEVMSLRRCGVLFDMGMCVYSLDDIVSCPDVESIISNIKTNDALLYSNCLSPAGLLLSDLMLEYFFKVQGPYSHWLSTSNKSMHLGSLVVDEDVVVKKNMVVHGDTSSGGSAIPEE